MIKNQLQELHATVPLRKTKSWTFLYFALQILYVEAILTMKTTYVCFSIKVVRLGQVVKNIQWENDGVMVTTQDR